jgi:hypothetical protein
MVRAHFNIRLDGSYLPASAAQWVADGDAARAIARTIVQRLMRQHGGDPRLLDAAMVITDEDGATLLEMTFLDTLYLPVEPVAELDRRRPNRARPGSQARIDAVLRPVRRFASALGARMQPLLGH